MDNQSDTVGESNLITPANPGLVDAWEQRIAETDRLQRFFAKLFGEVAHVGADEVEFVRDGETLTGGIRKDRRSIKSITVRAGWLPAMIQFLAERSLAVCGHVPASFEEVHTQTDVTFHSALSFDDRIVTFKVSRQVALSGRHRLSIAEFEVMPRGRILDLMFGGLHIRDACERLLRQVSGVTLVGAPDVYQLQRIVNSFHAISSVVVIGDTREPKTQQLLVPLSRSHHVVVTTISRDVSEVMSRLREMGISPSDCDVRGVLCNAFVRRSCEGCSKKAKLAPQIMSDLPDFLGQLSSDLYVVGRGCETCGQSGFHGFIGIQGAIIDDEETLPPAAVTTWGLRELADRYYSKGMRSLLEDGVRKALAGSTTIESVLQISRVIPEVYRTTWDSLSKSESAVQPRDTSASEPDLQIPDDFFTQKGDAPAVVPTIARQLPVGGKSDSAPLFEPKKSEPKRSKPLILIVEDDADQRAIVELTLKAADFDVIQASNGAEGLEVLENDLPDLIVSDLMMPVMDGGEFVMRCKSTPRLHKIPILMLTVVADEEREYALLDMGADDYCEKTIQRKVLIKRIEKLLERSKEGAQVSLYSI